MENKKAPIEGVCALPAEVLPYCLPAEADGLTKNSIVITELLVGQQVFISKSKPRLTQTPEQKQNKRPETIWVSLRKQTLERSNG